MNELNNRCVGLLVRHADATGINCKEANIWILYNGTFDIPTPIFFRGQAGQMNRKLAQTLGKRYV